MVLSEIDRTLLQRCLDQEPNAWREFVDRFLGLVIHVVNHTAQSRSAPLTLADREDLASEVFCTMLEDDYAVLRRFRGDASLSTYLTVISRRIVVRELLQRKPTNSLEHASELATTDDTVERIEDRDQVAKLLAELDDRDAEIVRRYHLDGHSYREISEAMGIAENSVGPTLSRARTKLRQHAQS